MTLLLRWDKPGNTDEIAMIGINHQQKMVLWPIRRTFSARDALSLPKWTPLENKQVVSNQRSDLINTFEINLVVNNSIWSLKSKLKTDEIINQPISMILTVFKWTLSYYTPPNITFISITNASDLYLLDIAWQLTESKAYDTV